MTSNNHSEWQIGFITTPTLQWGPRSCTTCQTILLTGEKSGFCCGPNGNRFRAVPALPPLPVEYHEFIHDSRISHLSRKLNLIFSFASMESSHAFPTSGHPSFLAIAGKTYHRIRSNANDESAIRWMLYDGFENSAIPHRNQAQQLPALWIYALSSALSRINPLTTQLLSMHQLQSQTPYPTACLIIQDSGCEEIAAVMRYNDSIQSEIRPRSLIISNKDTRPQYIPTISRFWEPLVYPLLFPAGTLGWGVYPIQDPNTQLSNVHDSDKPTTQIWFYRARLLREERFAIFGRLTNEYVVDMFSRDLDCRLQYIRSNQLRLRAEEEDSALMGLENVSESDNIYLPASFLGSWRWASNQIADSLTIAATYGPPTFFVTFTCNAEWPEITSRLRPGQTYADVPVVVCRVFKQKMSKLFHSFRTMFPNAGPLLYIIYSVEFQKRGLPHAHILLKYAKDCLHPDDIDAVISAGIPDNSDDAALLRKFMLHNDHGTSPIISNEIPTQSHPLRYCEQWKHGARICRFGYPKPLRQQTEITGDGYVLYKRPHSGDERVVPHCLALLKKFKCHMNFEIGGAGPLFQYLFKYIHKGPDYGRFRIQMNDSERREVDEIEDFWNARYLSATEGTWRILGFHITQKTPAVTPLPIHLPSSIRHNQYHRRLTSPTQSKLLHYFARPHGTFTVNNTERSFESLLYIEYFSFFRLQAYDLANDGRQNFFRERQTTGNSQAMHVVQRLPHNHHLARLQPIHLSRGEIFYIRALLQNRPALSFDDLRTINDVTYPSYQEACIALGIFANESEAEYSILEAVTNLSTPRQLRFLFIHLLTNDCVHTPVQIWTRFEPHFTADYRLQNNDNCTLASTLTLNELGTCLEEFGKTLSDFGLPQPSILGQETVHEINRWSSQAPHLLQTSVERANTFNTEQTDICNEIVYSLTNELPLTMFIDGKAGRGKTFLVNVLCDWVRGQGHIVLPTATSAFAAQLYPGGRTTHSTFKVPVNENNELLTSKVKDNDGRAHLIRTAKLIIWDEAPMANRAVLACVEEVCRKVMKNDLPFGGKVVVLLGDFRQTCPVIKGSTKAQVVAASIRSSPLWPLFNIRRLSTPIRNAMDIEFAQFIDDIGDGQKPDVDFPLLQCTTSEQEIIDFTFPPDILCHPTQSVHRAILTPTNMQADKYNDIILNRLSGQQKTYFAADSLEEREDVIQSTDENETLPSPDALLDYVARRRPKGMPHHRLQIKVGAVYRLLRNFSIDRGLVKNIRVVVTGLGQRLISVRVLKPTTNDVIEDDEEVLIPRINFKETLSSAHTLLRRQFPLAPAYATTFHSCQGLTLKKIAADVTLPVFTHGQLYTALSRVRRRQDVCILLPTNETTTRNVTYIELLL